MKLTFVTLFPEMFAGFLSHGILAGAIGRGEVTTQLVNPRDFTEDKHRTVDDSPYGGFAGMVLKPEPLARAIEAAQADAPARPRVILTSPQGRLLDHACAARLASQPSLVLVSGRYKGVDERVREKLVDEEVSIGDYVLSGGELAAMVIADAVARLLPGALGDPDSAKTDSFFEGILDSGYYTRPEVWRGMAVPPVLLSGHHVEVRRWQRREALRRTLARRPELLDPARLSTDERAFLREIVAQQTVNDASE
ncbi:MAG: tRNA (guanosine(37)-N1)-methyltransferase TrmD [bacterium]